MNKTLTILIIAGLIGVAYSACGSTCATAGGTCNTAGTTCTCPAGYTAANDAGTNDGCIMVCDTSCTATVGGSAVGSCNGGSAYTTAQTVAKTSSSGASCTCANAAYKKVGINFAASGDGCATCDSSCAANGGTCSSTGTCSGCTAGAYKPGQVKYSATLLGSSSIYDGCVKYDTANPTTDSASSAFNVTPVAVFAATEYTSPSAFAYASNSILYGGGFDDQTYYVWSIITSGSTVAVNRRTLGANFTKQNSSDTAISTTISTSTSSIAAKCVGAGYLGLVSYTAPTNWGSTTTSGTAAPTAGEIYFSYIATNGTSASTPKALTGNTNVNVYLDVQQCWYDSGIFYITWVQSTHTPGVAAAAASGSTAAVSYSAETWALKGLYIQGINVTSGALYYTNSTGGVQAVALTASNTGTCGGASPCTTPDANSASKPQVSFMFGPQNYTNSSTVSYLMTDSTGTYKAIKYGTITMSSGVGSTGTALVTEAAATGAASASAASSTTPYVVTSYSAAGFLGSTSTYGVFVNKQVQSYTAAATSTSVYTVLAYLNGSTTANSSVVTIGSGYGTAMIMGYGTSDGYVLIERQKSNSAASTSSPYFPNTDLVQAERFFSNGTAYSAAVSLGTYMDSTQVFQDTNGSILVGWTTQDYANLQGNYQGYLGKYLYQTLATAASLTSIIGLLSLLIVALFAF